MWSGRRASGTRLQRGVQWDTLDVPGGAGASAGGSDGGRARLPSACWGLVRPVGVAKPSEASTAWLRAMVAWRARSYSDSASSAMVAASITEI